MRKIEWNMTKVSPKYKELTFLRRSVCILTPRQGITRSTLVVEGDSVTSEILSHWLRRLSHKEERLRHWVGRYIDGNFVIRSLRERLRNVKPMWHVMWVMWHRHSITVSLCCVRETLSRATELSELSNIGITYPQILILVLLIVLSVILIKLILPIFLLFNSVLYVLCVF